MQVKYKKRVEITGVQITLTAEEVRLIRSRLVVLHKPAKTFWRDCPELDRLDNALIDFIEATE